MDTQQCDQEGQTFDSLSWTGLIVLTLDRKIT